MVLAEYSHCPRGRPLVEKEAPRSEDQGGFEGA
jgi:hypothetical protein